MTHASLRHALLGGSLLGLGACCGSATVSGGATYSTTPPPSQAVVVESEQPPPPPPPPPQQVTVQPAPPPQTETRTGPRVETRRVAGGTPLRINQRPPRRVPRQEQPETPFGSTTPADNALTGNIYFLEPNTPRLPNLLSMQPVGQIYTRRIDIPDRRFDQGFPGISERFEWFAVRYSGTVAFPATGEYRFRLRSDDGAKLYIDGQVVVDNDGTHPPRDQSGTVTLTEGNHEVVIEYFQGPRYQIALQLFMTVPGGREAIFALE